MNIAVIFDTLRPDTIGIYYEKALRALGHNVDHFQSHEIQNITGEYQLYLCIDDGLNKDEIPKYFFPKVFYAIDVHLPGPERKMRKKVLNGSWAFSIRSSVSAKPLWTFKSEISGKA
ncbi:MAG: hypothetical protein KKB22_00025 [Candidatus Omnitrophica bacterium]|nr:hypothetical protein [Candidatus Omnitrophota bacterium]